jgi:hypothetical protein
MTSSWELSGKGEGPKYYRRALAGRKYLTATLKPVDREGL